MGWDAGVGLARHARLFFFFNQVCFVNLGRQSGLRGEGYAAQQYKYTYYRCSWRFIHNTCFKPFYLLSQLYGITYPFSKGQSMIIIEFSTVLYNIPLYTRLAKRGSLNPGYIILTYAGVNRQYIMHQASTSTPESKSIHLAQSSQTPWNTVTRYDASVDAAVLTRAAWKKWESFRGTKIITERHFSRANSLISR